MDKDFFAREAEKNPFSSFSGKADSSNAGLGKLDFSKPDTHLNKPDSNRPDTTFIKPDSNKAETPSPLERYPSRKNPMASCRSSFLNYLIVSNTP